MAQLGRKALLQKQLLKREKVEFEDGDFVFVTEMTGRGRDNFEQSLVHKLVNEKGETTFEQRTEDFRAKLAVQTVCEEDGALVFLPEDWDELSQNMGASRLEKIVEVANRLNAISKKDQDDLVKNLKPGPENNSSSGSVGK
jgi:hypothetical protein